MDFTALMNMFAPRPGMDPFAAGANLATNPEQMVDQLAQLGPPPPQGQPIADFFMQKSQNMPQDEGALPAGARPTSYSPEGPVARPGVAPVPGGNLPTGAGPFAQPAPGGTVLKGPVTPAPTGPFSTNPTAASPLNMGGTYGLNDMGMPTTPMQGGGFPSFDINALNPGYTGVETVPGVGPVPTTGGAEPPDNLLKDESQRRAMGPTPPGGGRKPEILARPDERHVPQGDEAKPAAPMDPAKQKAIQDAIKGMGGMLAGLKAPPAPETQKISSPSAPRPTGTIQGGGIAALLSQLAGSAPAAQPLRLGNALYAGGRGIY